MKNTMNNVKAKIMKHLSNKPISVTKLANLLGLDRNLVLGNVKKLVRDKVIKSKRGQNGGVYVGETIAMKQYTAPKTSYTSRNFKQPSLAKCGHVTQIGRYFHCEACKPNLESDDGLLVYFQTEEEYEDVMENNCE